MKKIPVEDCVGMVLCQDITKIVPGEFKGRAFKKGYVIKSEDIPELLKLGKEHLYVWEPRPDEVHEDEAAMRLVQAVAGANINFEEPREGKATLKAGVKGLFRINTALLEDINSIEDISVASLPDYFTVEKGQKVGGARVVPLVIPEAPLKEVERLCCQRGTVFDVKPYHQLKAGIVTTGNEVFKGRIQDKFGPVMKKKLEYFEAEILGQILCPDEMDEIVKAINKFVDKKADLVLLTGGMSVDPDDLTPGAIRKTGARVVTYGVPVQPGNMLMMAYLDNTVLLGVPGCGMYYKTTVLDAVLPRVFAGEEVDKRNFAAMGAGGFCLTCEVCRYPNCYFCR